MRIAFLTPYLPFPPDTGGKLRSYHLFTQLARRHEVDVFTVHYEEHPRGIEEVKKRCSRLYLFRLSRSWSRAYRLRQIIAALPRSVDYFHTAESLAVVRQYLTSNQYDLIFVDELVMIPYAMGLTTPCVLSQQKIDYAHYWETAVARSWGQEKLLDYLEALKLKRFLAHALRADYIQCIVCSTIDEQIVHQMNPRITTFVMPNGVDMSQFPEPARYRTTMSDEGPTLAYVGTMSYYPNIDAILYFWREMYQHIAAQIPNVRLLIVGHNPPREILRLAESPNVVVTGTVPDVRPYLNQSTAMIVPLRLGGGTRLKILEAMAMGVPIVSTSVGCQVLNLVRPPFI